MAVVEIDTREHSELFECKECGSPPQPLRDNDALRDPKDVSKEHNQATGHRSRVIVAGAAYLTLRAGTWVEVYDYIPPWRR